MLRQIRPADKYYPEWIDIENPTKVELQAIAVTYGFNNDVVIDCMDPGHLPKYEEGDDSIFIIGRLYDINSDVNAVDILKLTRKLAIFCNTNVVITVHRSPQPLIDEVSKKLPLREGKYASNRYHILALLLTGILSSYNNLANNITGQLDHYEDQLFLQKQIPDLTRKFYFIKRKASLVLKVLDVSSDAICKLEMHVRGPVMQELKDTLIRSNTQFESLLENSSSLINTYLSLTSQRTNDIMRTLTILSVFFMPLTFIVGVYGMNFDHMPELKAEHGYLFVWVAMLIISLLILLYFRQKKWI